MSRMRSGQALLSTLNTVVRVLSEMASGEQNLRAGLALLSCLRVHTKVGQCLRLLARQAASRLVSIKEPGRAPLSTTRSCRLVQLPENTMLHTPRDVVETDAPPRLHPRWLVDISLVTLDGGCQHMPSIPSLSHPSKARSGWRAAPLS
ncbi:hypothetical protein LIA77_10572 [Sarocladium implicatum]|nr:hypothetical protein LIA77_10572 [Sarocladium implicatum]